MSDQQGTPKKQDIIVKPVLGFIDNNVLFKKPVSCLFAIVSLLIPLFLLIQIIQFGVFKSNHVELIFASLLILAIFAFAGIFGTFIWWHRRIILDEGPSLYRNFKRFAQTLGEWSATFIAITVFGGVITLIAFLPKEYYVLTSALPISIPAINLSFAFLGPIAGFLIIVIMKIFFFLLDILVWLLKQIWYLFVRIVKYFYRCIVKIHGTIEKNTQIWSGVIWLLAVAVVITGLVLCLNQGGLYPIFVLLFGLGFCAYLVFKRKHYDA